MSETQISDALVERRAEARGFGDIDAYLAALVDADIENGRVALAELRATLETAARGGLADPSPSKTRMTQAAALDLETLAVSLPALYGAVDGLGALTRLKTDLDRVADCPEPGRPIGFIRVGLRRFEQGGVSIYLHFDETGSTILRLFREKGDPAALIASAYEEEEPVDEAA